MPQRARPPARPDQLEHPEREKPASPERRHEDENLVPQKRLHASIESRPHHPDLENWRRAGRRGPGGRGPQGPFPRNRGRRPAPRRIPTRGGLRTPAPRFLGPPPPPTPPPPPPPTPPETKTGTVIITRGS